MNARDRRWTVTLSFCLVAALVPLAGLPAVAETAVFINEIHYDNDGTDSGEAIEVAGPTGTDLTGWSLVLYNGSGGATYGTTTLSGTLSDQGGGFGVTVVTYPTNGIQNGSPDGIALVDSGGTVVQFLSYEGTFTAVGGPADGMTSTDIGVSEGSSTAVGESLQLTGTGLVYEDFAWSSPSSDTFGSINTGQTFDTPTPPPIETCDDVDVAIGSVQGPGASSPLDGTTVTVQGVVVGDFETGAGLSGFYLQDAGDGDPATSDGVFIANGSADSVSEGDVVQVTGTVDEEFGQTEIEASSIVDCDGTLSISPTSVTFPVSAVSDLERFEGMLVVLPQDLVISEYFNFDRFGEIVVSLPLAGLDRLFTPTAVVEPGSAAQALAAEYALRRITIDDGRSGQNPDPAIHPGNGMVFDLANRFRGGDLITDMTGVLGFGFGLYRIQPTAYGTYTPVNPRPAQAPDVGGRLQVAAFNTLNYFSTLDLGPDVCGPARNLECRGADTAEEQARQLTKLVAALVGMDAEVVGLVELENTTGVEPMEDIVGALNAELGPRTYDYIDTGTIGTDAIKVGIIYKRAAVTPVGHFAILDSTVDARFLDDFNRPVLAQSFVEKGTGAIFTVAVNHLKSKGSDCDAVGDPDTGDGQGNCNLTRLAAAEAMVDWLASHPTGPRDADVLIIGDLNSYDHEDPIDAIREGSDDQPGTGDDYVDLLREFVGEHAYSFVFDGQFGYLDCAMSSASMTDQVTGAAAWHINADEPDILDYDMSFKQDAQDALFEPNAFRSSDHDPVLVGLDLVSGPGRPTGHHGS